jgi:hypothetical protein
MTRIPMLLLIGCCALLCATTPTPAGFIAEYTFDGNTAGSGDADANSTASLFGSGGGGLTFSALNSGSGGGASVFQSYGDLADSFSSAGWFGFSVTPGTGTALNLEALTFDARRDKVTGPGTSDARIAFELRSSVDGFATFESHSITPSEAINGNNGDWTSFNSAHGLGDVTQEISFRLFVRDEGYSSSALGFHLDNVRLSGGSALLNPHSPTLTNPEPASAVLFGLGLLAPAAAWRRRHSAARARAAV